MIPEAGFLKNFLTFANERKTSNRLGNHWCFASLKSVLDFKIFLEPCPRPYFLTWWEDVRGFGVRGSPCVGSASQGGEEGTPEAVHPLSGRPQERLGGQGVQDGVDGGVQGEYKHGDPREHLQQKADNVRKDKKGSVCYRNATYIHVCWGKW